MTDSISRFGRIPRELKRYLVSGATTASVSFVLMTLLVAVFHLPAQIALAISFAASVAVNFTLSRQWVWVHESGYAHHLSAQGRRYILVAVSGYGATALALATLPTWLGVPVLVVYFPTIVLVASASFVCSQIWVFRSRAPRLLLALRRRSHDPESP